ncbi:MAG: hypothetical protein ABWZ25_15630 [Chitinophagaceae bacterium]
MFEQARHIIPALTGKWKRNRQIAYLLACLSLTLFLTVISICILTLPYWSGIVCLLLSFFLLYIFIPRKRINNTTLSSYLNNTYPDLEESAQLLLIPEEDLGTLQRLQIEKTGAAIIHLPVPGIITRPIKNGLLALLIATLLSGLLIALSYYFRTNPLPSVNSTSVASVSKEIVPVSIRSHSIRIDPPVYTRKPVRKQDQFSLVVEEGSLVSWTIHTNRAVPSLQIVFNGNQVKFLKPSGDSTTWILEQVIKTSGYYQVNPGTEASPLYKIDIVPDKPVTIQILTPKQYTTIQAGQSSRVILKTRLVDDYGISDASIVATRASGKGEAVSFKEEVLRFDQALNGNTHLDLTRIMDLSGMGLKPGDELYFYIKARDNHGQESRSEMYFISLPDTDELLNMSGMTSAAGLVPEYFRSQRQIILDTEKLLKEKNSIPEDSFRLRSNELGNDQKLLRLRYGKFLGEENESGAHSPDDGHDHGGNQPAVGDAKALMDQMGHHHDNAEDASFFEPAQKAQLKAVLTEMWGSELKLRTYLPSAALPYEYKALKLLKDLQQKSRAYVAKTATKMTPLNPEKRLTGDLGKIYTGETNKTAETEQPGIAQIRVALSQLERLKQGSTPSPDQSVLSTAERMISDHAITEPSKYLAALSAIRSLNREQPGPTGQPVNKTQLKQIKEIEAALQRILGEGKLQPQPPAGNSPLGNEYFNQLNRVKE